MTWIQKGLSICSKNLQANNVGRAIQEANEYFLLSWKPACLTADHLKTHVVCHWCYKRVNILSGRRFWVRTFLQGDVHKAAAWQTPEPREGWKRGWWTCEDRRHVCHSSSSAGRTWFWFSMTKPYNVCTSELSSFANDLPWEIWATILQHSDFLYETVSYSWQGKVDSGLIVKRSPISLRPSLYLADAESKSGRCVGLDDWYCGGAIVCGAAAEKRGRDRGRQKKASWWLKRQCCQVSFPHLRQYNWHSLHKSEHELSLSGRNLGKLSQMCHVDGYRALWI